MSVEQWVEGEPQEGGYARYGDSPYYDVPDGWEILVEQDWAGAYEFDMIVVWRQKDGGQLRAAYDSGCSCPTPFSDLDLEVHGKLIREVDDLKSLVDRAAEYETSWGWDKPDDKLAEIKARVHRALRDAQGEGA